MTTTYSATETADRLAIIELIGRLVLVLDARDWDALGELFTDTVYSDRTSLLGGDPVTVSREDFVAGWKQTLQNLDAVHHMITCHVITLDGDRATCTANMMGTHVLSTPTTLAVRCGRSAAATTTGLSGLLMAGRSPG